MVAEVPLESCTEACGWVAALVAVIGFGSFGVPVKSDAANKVNIDPFVMQTYKSTMCFVLSFTVLWFGVEFSFTPWAILSGLFWVPGGTAVIYGIRNAGLALTTGVNSSLIVLVSFTWGIFIFHEPVKSRLVASLSILLMLCGIWGMAYFSQPHLQRHDAQYHRKVSNDECEEKTPNLSHDTTTLYSKIELTNWHSNGSEATMEKIPLKASIYFEDTSRQLSWKANKRELAAKPLDFGEDDSLHIIYHPSQVMFCGMHCSRRTFGALCAIFSGVWGGSIMVPMHYAGSRTKGMGYVISFGIGQLIVTIVLWIFRYMYNLHENQCNFSKAFSALPSLHLKEMWLAGCLCGSLWEIANVGSIVAVQFLGVGVGYSVVQSAFLVSGLWGIFWFREIRGQRTILSWLASAALTITGVLLLTYEHGSQ